VHDRHHRVKELFVRAREIPRETRAAWLEAACGDDASVRGEVESLLAAEEAIPREYLQPGGGLGLSPGTSVSHYRLVAHLATGGMGEVWLAHDETLDRRVALKFPTAERLRDPAVRQRLRREARVAAALDHPAICHVFELGDVDGRAFFAMEHVEGEPLAARLARGPVPLAQALAWGAAIAAALEEAHAKGIVHRDLKPANVMVTPAGAVKVMDFGLARLLPARREGEGGTGTTGLTAPGTIVGTPAYLAPEQLKEQAADERSDIWAFGCLLFELLTGTRAFAGDTVAETTAAILDRDPDWPRLPAETPGEIRRLLARCLRKDAAQRLRHIGDARLALEEAASGEPPPGGLPAAPHAPPAVWGLRRWWLAAALLLFLLGGLAAWSWLQRSAAPPAAPARLTAGLPPGVSVTRGPGIASSVALSPDGRTLVIAGTDANGQRLYRRTLDRLEATPMAGTEGGSSPFFSSDGAWVGFFADRRVKRVPAGGGAAVDIAAAPGYPDGASWGADDRIVFTYGARSPLQVVSADGGNAEPLTRLDAEAGELNHADPQFLPDGQTLLFVSGGWVHALDVGSGRRTALVEGAAPRYAASGHLILSRGTTLLAAPLDPMRLELTGPVVPLIEGVAIEETQGTTRHVAVSRSGALVYVPAARAYTLVLVEADGTERLRSEEARLFQNPQFSPDGRRLAVATTRRAGEQPDVWIYDTETGTPPSRLTFDGGRAPVWTPDGAAVTYSHPVPGEGWGIYSRSADGRGDAEPIVPLTEFHWLVGWTPDGRMLAYGTMEGVAADGVSRSSIVAFAGGVSRRVVGPGQAWGGRLSPDGRWLAYYSLESGYFEVYVTPFPYTDTQWLIAEGTDPAWSPDGTEVYYRHGSRLMAARIDTASGIRVLSRRVVIEPFSPPLYDDYDIHPDGRTLVMVRPAGHAQGREVTLVLNWLTELQRTLK
jgi:Tol biopolymer transport system component